jgi:hypothetical protein
MESPFVAANFLQRQPNGLGHAHRFTRIVLRGEHIDEIMTGLHWYHNFAVLPRRTKQSGQ